MTTQEERFSPTQREELRKLAEGAISRGALWYVATGYVAAASVDSSIPGDIVCEQPGSGLASIQHWPDRAAFIAGFNPGVAVALLDALDAAEGALLSASRDHAQTTCSALEWRPIETAPRDRDVLVTNDTAVGEARYHEDHDGWWWANTHPTDYVDGKVWQPTHWQPLPAPPGSASTGVAAQVVGDKSREELEHRAPPQVTDDA